MSLGTGFIKLGVAHRPGKTDGDRRLVADVLLGDGTVLNQELVKAGLWWFRRYSSDERLKQLEAEGR